jgi:amino acid adenylation domain-containing protein
VSIEDFERSASIDNVPCMNTLDQKIATQYWVEKLRKTTSVDFGALQQVSTQRVVLAKQDLAYFSKITSGNEIVEFTVLLTIFNILIQRYFETHQLMYTNGIGSVLQTPLLFSTQSVDKKITKQLLQEIKEEVQEVYKHTRYDSKLIETHSFSKYTPFGFFYNSDATEKTVLPFSIVLKKQQDTLEAVILFSESFTETHVAKHFLENFKNWVLQLEQNLSVKATEVSLLQEGERIRLLEQFNNTQLDYNQHTTLLELFKMQVVKSPNATAIIHKDRSLTYQELDEKTDAFANWLTTAYQLEAGDLVAVKLERTENLLVAFLAVLKIGAAYVPLDINYPEERIQYIEKDSNSKLIIDQKVLEKFHAVAKKYQNKPYKVTVTASQTAYIIYTSGSTGKPKGVVITHANAVAMIKWAQQEYDATRFEVVYAVTSHCFDLSIYEMFYTLSIGKPIKLFSNALDCLPSLQEDSGILLNTVPSVLRTLLEEGHELKNVSVINLAGEAFPVAIARQLQHTDIEVRNLYGPSEDTTYSTYYKLSNQSYTHTIPIGKPISNTQAYILDDNGALVPVGVPGKLYLSGAGITKGYLHRPALTSEKFIPNPFKEATLMYDTGDLAKWMPDGNIIFLGRKDHQVKLRGYRIELEEIEVAVQNFSEAIRQVVTVVKSHLGEDVLVAYYVADETVDANELRMELASRLPAYMIPSHFIALDAIPQTPNGKVDRKALPEIATVTKTREAYVAPTDDIEKALVAIWETVLGVERIGINDHFFELGGHSLMIGQLNNSMYKNLQKSVPFRIFYTNPTIASLKEVLVEQEYQSIPKATVQ